ncbi:MAG: hypothetical protein NT070_18540 [Cyanobacteria bacterium]|nr:hypothetical protein [Cyanobacteriota bacterium]
MRLPLRLELRSPRGAPAALFVAALTTEEHAADLPIPLCGFNFLCPALS